MAQILSLSAFGAFAALLPVFFDIWHLSATEAGWINGLYLAAYMAGVPVLVALTDRLDARLVFIASAAAVAASLAGFAYFAQGFWSALAFRLLAGAGLAGTYMPGLKALTDRLPDSRHARAVAYYTASFSVGTAASFLAAGALESWFGWRAAIASLALGPVLGIVLVLLMVRPRKPASAPGPVAPLLDFRPVLRNRQAMAYILAYAAHSCELFAFRGWIVAFLVFAQSLRAPDAPGAAWSVTALAALAILLGLPASVLGNEAAMRWGRKRVVIAIMVASASIALVIGFLAGLSMPILVLLLLVYGCSVTGESASVTAGALGRAPRATRGSTMAVHSFIGFAGASAGPVVFGWVLDLAGGQARGLAWGLAFASMGIVVGLGALALGRLADRGNVPGASRRS